MWADRRSGPVALIPVWTKRTQNYHCTDGEMGEGWIRLSKVTASGLLQLLPQRRSLTGCVPGETLEPRL